MQGSLKRTIPSLLSLRGRLCGLKARLTCTSQLSTTPIGSTRNPDISLDSVLTRALSKVAEHGWNSECVSAACEDVGLPAIAHKQYAQDGMDLVLYAMKLADYAMIEHMQMLSPYHLAEMDATQRVFEASKIRLLHMGNEYRGVWAEAIGLGMQPDNVSRSLHGIATSIDEIWHQAGDRSTDLTWYSRRLLLAGAYSSTEVAMLTDQSDGYTESLEFLYRRLDEVRTIGTGSGDAFAVSRTTFQGVSALGGMLSHLANPLIRAEVGNSTYHRKSPNESSMPSSLSPRR